MDQETPAGFQSPLVTTARYLPGSPVWNMAPMKRPAAKLAAPPSEAEVEPGEVLSLEDQQAGGEEAAEAGKAKEEHKDAADDAAAVSTDAAFAAATKW